MQYYFQGFGILVIIIFILTLIFINIPSIKRLYNLRKRLLNESDYVKKRKQELIKSINYESSYRKKYFNYLLILCGVSIVLFFFSWKVLMKNNDHSFIVLFLFLGCAYGFYKIISDYKKGFEDNVLKNVIQSFKNDLVYVKDSGFTNEEYKTLNFPERYNKFSSSDLIKNNNFYCSNILVENDTSDSDNNIGVVTIYEGSLARVDIKNTNSQILIGNISKLISMDASDKKLIIDNDIFNKLYNVSSNNEDLARSLLSSEVIDNLINLKRNIYGRIDIRIINDKLYIRFDGGDGFRPNLISKKMEMNSIYTSLIVLSEIEKTAMLLKNKLDVNGNYDVL